MLGFIIYLTVLILLLFFLISITIYTISLIYSSLMGSPYVATKNQRIDQILENANLKKNKIFIELGSGDGRVVRRAVEKYGVVGIGIDINPLLIFWAKLLSLKYKNKLNFITQNIFKTDLKKADYLYLFLMPKLIEKLKIKMEKELKKGTLVISHGFKIIGWEKRLIKTIKVNPFWTYYYRF